ncbi:MAG: hypothetical protein AMXMBFR59_28340 [Rhodanobacteraceae bacterium]
MSAALVAGAVGFAVVRQSSAQAAGATSAPVPAPAVVDLSDPVTRGLLTLVSHPARHGHADLPVTLYRRCETGLEDTYAVTRSVAFERMTYAELQRGNDGTWTAQAWQNDHLEAPMSPPPPPPPGVTVSACRPQPPVYSRHWQQAVSDHKAEALAVDFQQLSLDRVAPIRGLLNVQDGGTITLEGCVGGRYRLFLRASSTDNAARINAIADQLLAFAGVQPDDLIDPD